MKWVFLAVLVASFAPVFLFIRTYPSRLAIVWFSVGLLPFFVSIVHVQSGPVSWSTWLGYVKGIELTLFDVIALAVCLGTPPIRASIPLKISFALYFVAILFATTQSRIPLASLFYVFQVARMFLVYAAVVKGAQDYRMPFALMAGMTVGASYEAILGLISRAEGAIRFGGTFGHQNSLGMANHFVLYPSLALLLAGRKGWQPIVGCMAASIVVVLTASRATMGFAALGIILVFVLSFRRGFASRKLAMTLCAILAMTALTAAALRSLEGRFGNSAVIATDGERNQLKAAASAILSDHPLGIGPNMFATVSTTDGYSKAAGLTWQSTGSQVHNAYWLVAAETGYLGLVTYLGLLTLPLLLGWRFSARQYREQRGDLVAGLFVSLIVAYLHSFYEFVLLGWVLQTLLFITFGLIAGLSIALRPQKLKPRVNGYWISDHGSQAFEEKGGVVPAMSQRGP